MFNEINECILNHFNHQFWNLFHCLMNHYNHLQQPWYDPYAQHHSKQTFLKNYASSFYPQNLELLSNKVNLFILAILKILLLPKERFSPVGVVWVIPTGILKISPEILTKTSITDYFNEFKLIWSIWFVLSEMMKLTKSNKLIWWVWADEIDRINLIQSIWSDKLDLEKYDPINLIWPTRFLHIWNSDLPTLCQNDDQSAV